ncbi:hypothetical protein HO173_009420 [Letharia columbiana]|uniref:Zn(2)-C6 fungal-type domain-containing protein n=1 Tax=Letharia columbiana TaxID=112416 RepID=A0A8H6FPK2_9LECA|nr:uncharacterized protein HO173_009420 [Letharia columbiana]KAF6232315.1 hypothetical protein HO173_009420 [Letharia columbiana]
MSSNNFSTSAPNSRAPVLPQTLVSLADPPLLGGDEPLIFDELTGPYAMPPNDWYEWEDPMPTVTSVPGLQASPELWVPVDAVSIAPRQRHRAPAPTRQETEARHPELANKPEPKRRKAPPVKGVSGRVIEKKVEQACMRCRAAKQKCDGEKPHCRRCTRRNRRCSYVPTERQIEWAQKKAAGSANTPPESVEQPRTVAMTPPENYVLTAPGRRILPRPEAPGAAYGRVYNRIGSSSMQKTKNWLQDP